MKKKEQAELYRRQMGDEAADRQTQLAKFSHRCCGAPKDGPHHPFCTKARAGRR